MTTNGEPCRIHHLWPSGNADRRLRAEVCKETSLSSVDREQGGQLPISPCAHRSSPVVSCDYTVTSIRPQQRGRRVAGSGVCRGWRGFDLGLTKTLHVKNTCSQFTTVHIHISAPLSASFTSLRWTDSCCFIWTASDESRGRIKGDYAWNQMFELMICLYRIQHGQEASRTAAKWRLTAAFRSVTSSKLERLRVHYH